MAVINSGLWTCYLLYQEPGHQLTWNLTGDPFKRKMVFQDPRNVRFHVSWWDHRFVVSTPLVPFVQSWSCFFFTEPQAGDVPNLRLLKVRRAERGNEGRCLRFLWRSCFKPTPRDPGVRLLNRIHLERFPLKFLTVMLWSRRLLQDSGRCVQKWRVEKWFISLSDRLQGFIHPNWCEVDFVNPVSPFFIRIALGPKLFHSRET